MLHDQACRSCGVPTCRPKPRRLISRRSRSRKCAGRPWGVRENRPGPGAVRRRGCRLADGLSAELCCARPAGPCSGLSKSIVATSISRWSRPERSRAPTTRRFAARSKRFLGTVGGHRVGDRQSRRGAGGAGAGWGAVGARGGAAGRAGGLAAAAASRRLQRPRRPRKRAPSTTTKRHATERRRPHDEQSTSTSSRHSGFGSTAGRLRPRPQRDRPERRRPPLRSR